MNISKSGPFFCRLGFFTVPGMSVLRQDIDMGKETRPWYFPFQEDMLLKGTKRDSFRVPIA